MGSKRKIIVTESQYKVIEESENVIDDFRGSMDDIIKVLNAQFGRLAFASMADVMDGDIDLDVLDRKITEFHNIYNVKDKRVNDYFNQLQRTSADEYWDKWEDIHRELELKGGIVINKIESIRDLVGLLKDIARLDVEGHFSDIETRKI